jgi:hypothetical protein
MSSRNVRKAVAGSFLPACRAWPARLAASYCQPHKTTLAPHRVLKSPFSAFQTSSERPIRDIRAVLKPEDLLDHQSFAQDAPAAPSRHQIPTGQAACP